MNYKTYLREKSSVWHPNTQMKEWTSFDEIVQAKGMWLIDSQGNKMIDAVASMWCNVWGHSKQELVRAIVNQSKTKGSEFRLIPLFFVFNDVHRRASIAL